MSMRFRKSKQLIPGVKLNVTKRGLGLSVGVPGAHVSVNTHGDMYRSVGIPGSGISYTKRTKIAGSGKAKTVEPKEAPHYETYPPQPAHHYTDEELNAIGKKILICWIIIGIGIAVTCIGAHTIDAIGEIGVVVLIVGIVMQVMNKKKARAAYAQIESEKEDN